MRELGCEIECECEGGEMYRGWCTRWLARRDDLSESDMVTLIRGILHIPRLPHIHVYTITSLFLSLVTFCFRLHARIPSPLGLFSFAYTSPRTVE